ncbi:MAG: proline--tRNA ligase [Gemmatimonadetes bacterium]|uniref:Proline--tRNA ligase n=1 Tax=Candidatus Kutchimonas denitrificans TaxID=3056748 RepID=A0AAE4ZDB7_9BACT|nr:proline--tRNA ligase [Gemmatimonadota bacterium]NIR76195.1 proline--tRNA ligase [Candidatus Kutchimonas denitrificans]NIS00635.1 proline--tRNA ligase [Gemmatimonadota bacterium]NIT66780.1 proline--tRNA ligase [Gemmatimonadota bacterium]NIV23379.1 proline--tRNA ligase [Gemmatimonadota bacterium]
MAEQRALTPRAEDFSAWYNEVVQRGELAGYTPVRGCMVIRPHGYAIWELMQKALDARFKETGHQNAYFPLFIPQSFLHREAEHVEGFAPETAVVTHGGGKELEEPLVVRPTSEAIIWPIMADWIQSYRDLPLLINQWANVVRWEMRTRLFLRTPEFLWQEGHTAHASQEDAQRETLLMLSVYRRFMEEWMAMPPLTGVKTEWDKFAGADRTYACEALMQDNWALQAGTSHNLGQNFARAFDVKYQTEDGSHEYVWSTSWGVSTRLIGGLVMSHSDDLGLVLPPKLAPIQAVIVPIYKSDEGRGQVLEAAEKLAGQLRDVVRVRLDDRDTVNPGAKYYEWEGKGVPVRLEIGPKDLEKGQVMAVKRFAPDPKARKVPIPDGEVRSRLTEMLDAMQNELLATAIKRREDNSHRGIDDYEEFKEIIATAGGFVYTGYCGTEECEASVKDETKATIRLMPDEDFRSDEIPAKCICGKKAEYEVVWARAY